MSVNEVKHLDITIDLDDVDNGGYSVIEAIRPEWRREDICLKSYTEGWINHTLRFSLKSDEDLKDTLIVRVFGGIKVEGQDTIFLEKDTQIIAMQVAHSVGIAQQVMAIFNNGIVYKFAPGRTLTPDDTKDPDIIRLICQAAAGFHNAKWDSTKAYNISGELASLDTEKTATMFSSDMAVKNMEMLPEKLSDPEKDKIMRSIFPSKQEMKDLYFRAKERMDKGIPKCFQHNDFHIKNMVYSPEDKMLSLLDFEVVGPYWTGGDISRIPALAPIWKELGFSDRNYVFTDEDMLIYARIYFEEKNKILGLNPNDFNEKDIEKFHWQIRMCWAFSDLLMGLSFLVGVEQAFETKKTEQEGIPWDPLEVSGTLFKIFKAKEEFFFNSSPPC